MKTRNIVIYEASEGMWLTESAEGLDARTFSKQVVNPEEGAWTEWTDEQKNEWEEEHPEVPPIDDVILPEE